MTLLIIFFLSQLVFFSAYNRDPGYLVKDPSVDFLALLEQFEPNSLCPFCELI